jgi:8-oxo-dGTP diphosphatase
MKRKRKAQGRGGTGVRVPKGRGGSRGSRGSTGSKIVRLTKPIARFCMVCGGRMRSIVEHGAPRKACVRCGFISYRNPVPACGVVIQRSGTVLLAKRAHEPRKDAWGIPAGFMEYGEHPETTAVREALEETGLRVRIVGLFGVYAGRDDPRTRAVLILYHARVTGGRLKPGDDASEVEYFPLARPPRPIAFRSHREALADLRKERRKRKR